MAGVAHHTNSMWKNIAIGIGTTVVAYLIVHFITDKKDEKRETKKKGEVVEKAWNSIKEYSQMLGEKLENVSCYFCDEMEMKRELIRELDQMNKSLQNIKEDKDQDEKMRSILDRTIQQINDKKPVVENYYDSLVLIKKNGKDTNQALLKKLQESFFSRLNHIDLNDSSEMKKLRTDLEKSYNLSLKEYTPENEIDLSLLKGKWQIGCDKSYSRYEFKGDSTFTFDIYENGALSEQHSGKWLLNERSNELKLAFEDESSLVYVITALSHRIMNLYINENGLSVGVCPVKE
jgi:hypothetical protein